MGEETTTTPGGATPPNVQPATGTQASSGVTPTKPTIEELQARIAELERHSHNKTEEAGRHHKNLSEAQKKLAEYEEKERLAQEATLSEVEKSRKAVEAEKAARAQVEQQVQQLKQELISKMVQLSAKEKGIIDTELAALAIQGKLELGEDGMPTNVDKALDDLIKNKPYLAPKTQEQSQEQSLANPAQTANNQQPPRTPAMNPGRSAISAPQTLNPGQRVTFDQAYKMKQ